MSLIRTIVLVDLITVFVTSEFTAVVNTTFGPVQGEILTTVLNSVEYAAFKGIRYAKAPVGYQRFKPPIPVDPWTEVLNATTEGPCCVQIHRSRVIGSEDCLFLNVYTTVKNLEIIPKKLKSVMVWFYGGAWSNGSSSTEMYGPDFLMEKDIVFVTFNFRGGALGFLSLDHPNATGNAGLKDQKLALKWVQANIRNFGGNPNNVTIWGDSSGSISVGYHIISDASVGLFHGAISMSGTPLIPWGFQTVEQTLARAHKLGSLIGMNSTDKAVLLKAFYNVSAVDLVIATEYVGRIVLFTPTLEDANIATDVFLTKCSLSKYFSGNFTKVPQIIGYMDEETTTFTYCKKKEMGPYMQTITYIMDLINYLGMDMPKCLSSVVDTFDSWNSEITEFETALISESVKQMSDLLFISQIDLTQRIFAAYNDDKPVYYYDITFDMERSPHNIMRNCTIPGAGHGDDLAYIFYARQANWTLDDPESPMRITIHRVTTLMTNFAKYGNPTPDWVDENPLGVTWPDSGPKGLVLYIGDELKVGSRPMNENQKLIQSYYWVLLPRMQGCV